jgi:hypothetical protein
MKRTSMIALASLGLMLAVSSPSLAQHPHGGNPHGGNPCTDLSAHTEARITFLHSKLAITTAQESAFGSYATAIRAASQNVASVCASLPAAAPSAFPDKFDYHLKLMAAHVQQMTAMSAPNRAFYNALTPAQQSILDNMRGHGPKN